MLRWFMERPSTISGLLERAAQLHATHPAIEAGELRLDYRELLEAAQRTAAALIALGVMPGDRVAIWAPNRAEWIVAALGGFLAGATLVPVNTRFKASEAGYVLQQSRARVLFTPDAFLGVRFHQQLQQAFGGEGVARPVEGLASLEQIVSLDRSASGALLGFDAFLARGVRISREQVMERARAVDESDLSDIMFTSGTTGQPKGVATTHGQNIRAFSAWCAAVGLTSDDRYLIVSPFFHAFGYKAGWLACLIVGATILPHAVFDAGQVLERLRSERISVLPGPPTLYQSLLAHPGLREQRIPPLRLAVTGAAVIPVELVERMRSELGIQTVITGYGLTESCGIATMCRADDDAQTIATTSGRAIDGVEVKIVDSAGKALPAGEAGEVVIRGYNVMRGYFEAPAQTREVIDADGFLHTGDIGILDARGYLRITDRLKDMFIAGGFNCYPAEIERVIATYPGVAQVAVIGIPDERLGEVGMAFVVPTSSGIDREALAVWCREHMANYKVPRRFEVVAALPLNASGKVLKAELRMRSRTP
jgi:acyl-CoA synthetase (AMP-forming)/AMP-acid ligase II